jgi:ribonuclease D
MVTASESLPNSGEDYEYFSSSFHPEFTRYCQGIGNKASDIMKIALGSSSSSSMTISQTDLEDETKILAWTEKLRAKADSKLANVDKSSSNKIHDQPTLNNDTPTTTTHNNNNNKPQTKFHDYPIDNSRSPWIPKLPPPSSSTTTTNNNNSTTQSSSSNIPPHIQHHIQSILGLDDLQKINPFESTIREAQKQTPKWLWESKRLFLPMRTLKTKSQQTIPFLFVETEEQFNQMSSHLLDLNQHLAIAVDLEHHSLRSFQGFTCLMQISTSTHDYVIDTLSLRHLIPKLSPLFLSPNIVKVLHGADYDIEWLQKDFGIYVCQLFDTGQAARILGHASAGLAHALYRFCQVKANKQHQLSDWRIRPLPEDMLAYAREDTHYLLTIFDEMRMELLHSNQKKNQGKNIRDDNVGGGSDGIRLVLNRSADIACKMYEKPRFDLRDAMELLDRGSSVPGISSHNITDVQIRILNALYDWRDSMARSQDESPQYILPNRSLIRLVRKLATTTADVLDEIDGSDCEFSRSHVANIVRVINNAMSEIDDTDNHSEDNQVSSSMVMESNENFEHQVKKTKTHHHHHPERVRSPLLQEPSLSISTDASVHINEYSTTFTPSSQTLIDELKIVFPLQSSSNLDNKKAVVVVENNSKSLFSAIIRSKSVIDPSNEQLFKTTAHHVLTKLDTEVKRRKMDFDAIINPVIATITTSTNDTSLLLFDNQANFVSLTNSSSDKPTSSSDKPTSLQQRVKASKHDSDSIKKSEIKPKKDVVVDVTTTTTTTQPPSFAFSHELAESVGALVSSANVTAAATAAKQHQQQPAHSRHKNKQHGAGKQQQQQQPSQPKTNNPYLFKSPKSNSLIVTTPTNNNNNSSSSSNNKR